MSNKLQPKNVFNLRVSSLAIKALCASCAIFFAAFSTAAQQTTPPPTTTATPLPAATPSAQQQQQQRPENEVQQNSPPQSVTQQQQTMTNNPTPQQPQPQQQLPTQQTPQNVQPTGVTPSTGAAVLTGQTPNQTVGTSGGVAPAQLPNDPPPIAPNFEAPMQPLPSAERVGVDVSDQLPLSLQDAVTLALQNNNDIDASKNVVQEAEFDLKAARGVYDPVINTQNYYQSSTTPTASTIGGGANGSVKQSDFSNALGVGGFSPAAGGAYQMNFSTSRLVTNSQNATLNPQFPSALGLTYTQPLWRGLRFDNNRRQIAIAKKNLSLTDAQFRQKAIDVIAQVEQSYWDLAFALRNLQVQIDAVKQARLQLESNQRLVAKGALAPVDIIAANTQITTFEQNVYTAQQAVTKAENTLKTLMLPDRANEIWKRALVPVSPVELEIPRVPLEDAIASALTNRQELAQLKNNAEINQINERYYRDQTKPQINLVGTYTGNGLAGAPTVRTGTSTTTLLINQVNQLSTLAGLPPLNVTTTTTSVPPILVGGYPQSLRDVVTGAFPTYNVGVTISLPIGNRTAKANLGKTLVEANRIKNQQAQQEQIIESDVRNAIQALRSSEARLTAAAASRASAEQLYESEQRQFKAGATTVYLVLQRQTELVTARGNELQAQTLLNKAISDFQHATGSTLSANSVEISRGSLPNFLFRRPAEFGSSIFPNRKDKSVD